VPSPNQHLFPYDPPTVTQHFSVDALKREEASVDSLSIEAAMTSAVQSTAQRIIRHQRPDGAFSFCCEANPLPDALMIIFLYGIGLHADSLIPELSQRLKQSQNLDGSWSAYADQKDTLSATTLAYFALLLAGEDKSRSRMQNAQHIIRQQGGIMRVSNLTKIVLATAGQIPWSSVPGGHIEWISGGPPIPVNLYDFNGYARLHLVPFMLLSHLQHQFPVPDELSLADLILPSGHLSAMQKPSIRIPHFNRQAVDRCHTFLLERIEPNGTWASYLTATVFAVFALRALGYPAQHRIVQRAIDGLKGLVYRRHGVVQEQLFTSTVWDTSLCMQALQQVKFNSSRAALQRGAQYLLSRQHKKPSDWKEHNASAQPGGWGFSDVNTLYPDVDDSISALYALHPFQRQYPDAWRRGADWVLSMQNEDGGWPAFDKNCTKFWLEYLPINDMGKAMTDPSTADITGRVLEGIRATQLDSQDTQKALDRGVNWLFRHQRRNGSWPGRWGIAYLYGTWAAVRGLRASGIRADHTAMRKALHWVESVQHADGGFGESCRSVTEGDFVDWPDGTASQTAWGLMALMAASDKRTRAMDKAATFLAERVDSGGGWPEAYPTGAGVAGQAYLRYHSYPYVWPLLALVEYGRRCHAA
jgi:sporulenol synthase